MTNYWLKAAISHNLRAIWLRETSLDFRQYVLRRKRPKVHKGYHVAFIELRYVPPF